MDSISRVRVRVKSNIFYRRNHLFGRRLRRYRSRMGLKVPPAGSKMRQSLKFPEFCLDTSAGCTIYNGAVSACSLLAFAGASRSGNRIWGARTAPWRSRGVPQTLVAERFITSSYPSLDCAAGGRASNFFTRAQRFVFTRQTEHKSSRISTMGLLPADARPPDGPTVRSA
jgi:hypothetical protein